MVRLQPPVASSFTTEWKMAKLWMVGLYHVQSPPLAVEPFQALGPSRDLETLVESPSWGDIIKREEQEARGKLSVKPIAAGSIHVYIRALSREVTLELDMETARQSAFQQSGTNRQ